MKTLLLILLLLLSSCSDDKADDAEIFAGEQDSKIVTPKTPTKVVTPKSSVATYRYYNIGEQGKHAWRIPRKGPSFGSRLLIRFSSGFRVIVPNSSERCILPNGFKFRPGIGSIASGTGTSHGGVYIYGPKGDKSTTLTITRIR